MKKTNILIQPLAIYDIKRSLLTVIAKCSAAMLLSLSLVGLAGCGAIISSMVSRASNTLADNLTTAILENPDIDTVRDGVPAFLLMIDAMVLTAPDSADLKLSAARLYSAYAGGFITNPERKIELSVRALDYSMAALCLIDMNACDIRTKPIEGFNAWVADVSTPQNTELLYAVASTWAGWIQANATDWNAIAQLARVRILMDAVLVLDESFDYGSPHLYYGIFETLLPAALGGRPEIGRQHFERAIALSEGRYLMTKVMFANQYARLVYDRELHDKLLTEVLEANPQAPGITIINKLAQQQARELLDTADDYF